MNSPLVNAGSYLVHVVFGLFVFLVLLRFVLQLVRADFHNPISQMAVKLTNPALRPLRRFIPGWGGIDLPSVVLMWVLQFLELRLIAWIHGAQAPLLNLLLLAVVELLELAVWLFMGALIVQVILSWLAPGAYNPVTQIVYSITRPIALPLRRLIPPVAGFDFSLLAALVLLQLSLYLVIDPLRQLAVAI
jgi:YggT family protein